MDFETACDVFRRFTTGKTVRKDDLNSGLVDISLSGDSCLYVELALRDGLMNFLDQDSLQAAIANFSARSDISAFKSLCALFKAGSAHNLEERQLIEALCEVASNEGHWPGQVIVSAFENGVVDLGYGFEVVHDIPQSSAKAKIFCLGDKVNGTDKPIAISHGSRIFTGPEPFERLRRHLANAPVLSRTSTREPIGIG